MAVGGELTGKPGHKNTSLHAGSPFAALEPYPEHIVQRETRSCFWSCPPSNLYLSFLDVVLVVA